MEVCAVFFVSDRTGLTAESFGKSLLAQFPQLKFDTRTLAFVDSVQKAHEAKQQIDLASNRYGREPIIFSTLVGQEEQQIIGSCRGHMVNLFGEFLAPLEAKLGLDSAHSLGNLKKFNGDTSYLKRLDALDYCLAHDDGIRPDQYNQADVILVGVSRCGKTPTSLYLAMNLSLKACNYPLTEEDLEHDTLPDFLLEQRSKLVGFTIKPVPLSKIRKKRRPDSQYATLQQCQHEVALAEQMFKRANLTVFDTSETSIEEIASYVVRVLGISHQRSGFA